MARVPHSSDFHSWTAGQLDKQNVVDLQWFFPEPYTGFNLLCRPNKNLGKKPQTAPPRSEEEKEKEFFETPRPPQ